MGSGPVVRTHSNLYLLRLARVFGRYYTPMYSCNRIGEGEGVGGGEETGPWNGYREALGGPAGFPGPRWTVRGRASGLTTKKISCL